MMKRSSLRSQILFAAALACFAILSAQVTIRYLWTIPQFAELARYNDKLDLLRLKAAINAQLRKLQNFAYDNGVWDEVYQKAQSGDRQWFQQSFMIQRSLQKLSINGLYFYNNSGQLLAGMSIDNDGQLLDVKMLTQPSLMAKSLLIHPNEIVANQLKPITKTNFITINNAPAVVISQSLAPSNEIGPNAGTLVLWHYIDQQFISEMLPSAHDNIFIIPPEKVGNIANDISANLQTDDVQVKLHDKSLYLGILGIDNQLLLAIKVPQSPRLYDEELFNPALIAGIVVSIFTLFLLYLFISRKLVNPIRNLLKTISYVNFSNDYTARTNLTGHNEIHKLGRLIDRMFDLVERQQRKLTQKNQQLQNLSNTDALTGLANRRYLDEYLTALHSAGANRKQPLAMLVVDVDYFKRYNDFYGHALGDKVLQQVATTFQESTHRATDLVCRYGGEEFVLVLENTSKEEAVTVANHLCHAVEALGIPHQTSANTNVITISIGIAAKPADEIIECETLFAWADAALYIAKENGRNRYEIA
ncbi:diguanylate cyclase [Shewanella yunxiaonensis]|uniref:diguanylate cyclase n=1 Tax=Shewanella yunxiaonensis TaxID=2829809 RepID=A0ABX7YR71_9GAMM|nr:diguanylate cyclase [Shewanella yunxiaonensis]QUN04801.1 diguanylate cyclase [Shewanella yunxiaonensis]